MDFTRALMYPFDDPDWVKKLLFALVAGFIPIIGNPIALQGWSYEISRRVKAGDPNPLADWDDLGGLISRGLNITIAIVIYQLPTLIFGCLAFFVILLPAFSGNNSDLANTLGGLAVFVEICCCCLLFLYAIAAGLLFWGGYVRYLDAPELGTFFQFGDNLAIVRDNIGDFGMALIYVIGAALIASLASTVTAGLGGLLAGPFLTYFSAHILGQLSQKVGGGAATAAPMMPQV